jgi:hypothetical protein
VIAAEDLDRCTELLISRQRLPRGFLHPYPVSTSHRSHDQYHALVRVIVYRYLQGVGLARSTTRVLHVSEAGGQDSVLSVAEHVVHLGMGQETLRGRCNVLLVRAERLDLDRERLLPGSGVAGSLPY